MTIDQPKSAKLNELRVRAKARMNLRTSHLVAPLPEDSAQLIDELHAYQIELEMQNQELQRAQVELVELRDI